ncbi:MAG: hypothetical protein ACI9ZF_000760 [Bradyrhizobium sp.]|jgi:hypothetical protein
MMTAADTCDFETVFFEKANQIGTFRGVYSTYWKWCGPEEYWMSSIVISLAVLVGLLQLSNAVDFFS